MKNVIPVLEGYNADGQPIFGQVWIAGEVGSRMPLEAPEKTAGEFLEGGS